MQLMVATSVAMQKFGGAVAAACGSGCVIYLCGDLGVGKTTFVRGFVHKLGHSGYVRSPTFNLFEIYQTSTVMVCHFDLYRLAHPEELMYIGIADYFTRDNICLIEWPEHGSGFLQPADLCCRFDFTSKDAGRSVEIVAVSPKGDDVVKNLSKMG